MRSEFETRREIVEIGRRLWYRGYVAANDGNISARLGDRILVTPTGLSKGFLKADDIVVVSESGVKLAGRADPTSELPMHLAVYGDRTDVEAVVHAHPPKATGFAVAGVPLAQFFRRSFSPSERFRSLGTRLRPPRRWRARSVSSSRASTRSS